MFAVMFSLGDFNHSIADILHAKRSVNILMLKSRFKRRILHVPNLMQMRKIYCFRSFALDSAHVNCDV